MKKAGIKSNKDGGTPGNDGLRDLKIFETCGSVSITISYRITLEFILVNKETKVSTTDPDSGYMFREGKPKGFPWAPIIMTPQNYQIRVLP